MKIDLKNEVGALLIRFWHEVETSSLEDRYFALRLERLLHEEQNLEIPPPGFIQEPPPARPSTKNTSK